MKVMNVLKGLLVAMVLGAGSAHAALVTWELTATVKFASSGFTPPSFLSNGSVVKVLYVFDNQAPLSPHNEIFNAMTSVTLNGETSSQAAGTIFDSGMKLYGQVKSIDGTLTGRSDGITQISIASGLAAGGISVDSALWAFHNVLVNFPDYSSSIDFSVNFGLNNAVFASVNSFNQVPLPGAVYLLGSGLAGLVLVGRRRAARA